MLCGNMNRKKIQNGRNISICMAGSLCRTPETITLFVNWLIPNPKNGFFDSSAGKEFACNPGDPGLIPGSGRFTGEGIGSPL